MYLALLLGMIPGYDIVFQAPILQHDLSIVPWPLSNNDLGVSELGAEHNTMSIHLVLLFSSYML